MKTDHFDVRADRPKTQNQKFKVEDGTGKMSDTEIESQNSAIVKNENNRKVENEGRAELVFEQSEGGKAIHAPDCKALTLLRE